MAERFSRIGVPVFMADVKGDLSGITQPGTASPKLRERLKLLGIEEPAYAARPAVFWDVFGEQGHPSARRCPTSARCCLRGSSI